MSYNGSGTFNINSTGQPVVAGTVITASAFNALTTDLATGLTTAITKDGQTTTTARITFAQGVTSSLVTDSSSVSTGSIITDGGVGIAKNVYVGGTLNVTGSTTLTNPVINNIKMGYTTTATAAGTTTLTVASNYRQFFTGSTTQTIVLPVTSTLVTGIAYEIENNSTGLLTVNSSGGNLVGTIPAGVCAHAVCIGTTLTTAADWDWDYISTTTITGTGANVLGTSPTITTPTISSLSSAAATALTLQSAGTTAVTIGTNQYVGIGTVSPVAPITIAGSSNSLSGIVFAPTAGGGNNWGLRNGYPSVSNGYFTIVNETSSTVAVSIDTSNNLLAGGSSVRDGAKVSIDSSTNGISIYVIPNTSAVDFAIFRANSGTLCGAISRVGTTAAVVYTATSDYRLKENIAPISGALAKVSTLNPVTFTWKDGGGNADGFIAHEFAEVCPNGVIGEKNGVDEDGNPKYQAMDSSAAIPFLTAAIKELKAINDTQAETINALTARIVALENA